MNDQPTILQMQPSYTGEARVVSKHDQTVYLNYRFSPRGNPAHFIRPYIHDIVTPSGIPLTAFAPPDHPWHHGLSMTLSVVDDHNFWGGGTFIAGRDYVTLDNVGHTEHDGFGSFDQPPCEPRFEGESIMMMHYLKWQTADNETLLRENRKLIVGPIWDSIGAWTMEWESELVNITGRTLRIGSPNTQGRAHAGYGGLFWRGDDSWRGGEVLLDGMISGEERVNGRRGRWIAFRRKYGDPATLILRDHPDNPRYPTPWFVRSAEYPGICASFAYHEPYALEPDARLKLRYRIIVADGAWSPATIDLIATAWADDPAHAIGQRIPLNCGSEQESDPLETTTAS